MAAVKPSLAKGTRDFSPSENMAIMKYRPLHLKI